MASTMTELLSREKMTREWRWGLPLIIGIVVLDQITKAWVLDTSAFNALGCLSDTSQCRGIEISPIFDLTMTWNRGVSFGLLEASGFMRWVLVIALGGIAVGFSLWLFRAERWMTALALSLVVAGATGNLIDRVRFGAVVDFIDFSGPWFHLGPLAVGFPWIFNVADASISTGAVALLLDQVLAARKRPG